jgi:hypothetical protein
VVLQALEKAGIEFLNNDGPRCAGEAWSSGQTGLTLIARSPEEL